MATLNNPINKQNIVDRFADYVQATANSGISWGTNAKPFSEFPDSLFGGDTNGKGIEINGSSVPGGPTNEVTASGIYNTLVSETNRFTRIRNLRALLFVGGGGGNTGSRPTPGYVYDQTAVANLNGDYLQSIGSPSGGSVASGNTISGSGLESFFGTLQASYNSARSTTATYQVDVCHASCHSACHNSRSRR
jgi:hypothetical protein